MRVTARAVIMASVLGLVAGCANTRPQAPPGIPEASAMAPSSSVAGRLTWIAQDANFAKYTSIIIPPVTVYDGADASWGDTSPADRATVAAYMQQQFTRAIAKQYPIVTAPGPTTARVQFQLVGIESNVPVAATVSRLVPAGLVANIASQAAGQPGSFSGSVTYAALIYDSTTNRLIAAAVNKKFPEALNIGATFSTVDAAKAGIDEGATQLAQGIQMLRSGRARTGS
ncbi:conserved exported protein of unknown function [Rhodovastum atsumiense]|uniref:DUF3313 domain-containing protein n=1 Tax=Rhodovastum atsumiense TaxID=504468 RepID=A0A5M6ISD0_9PROT|nr:DUF3313 domain-containing protein [Rhodovastum atsumiense]KAA5611213.1 DUF3313 domain-containing protein [Rhodovastum atsumiense]CAH2602477.1 conserved exported protein of unknown function [Rhodovastum atsumiense]